MAAKLQALRDEDLPALHNAANSASIRAQKRYLILFGAVLFFMIAGAILSALSLSTPANKSLRAILSGISFLISFCLTMSLKVKKYEKDWYGGRAIAESVKTLTWRYMTRAEPYSTELTADAADDKFAADLNDVLSQRKYLSGALDGRLSNRPQITDRMQEIRSSSTQQRRDFYVTERIEDQRNWYSGKAKTSHDQEWRWFIVIMLAQIAAGVSAIYLISSPESQWNLTGFCSTLATAALAWLQVKRYQELAQSYNLTAQELGLIATRARHISTDDKLSAFVSDAENAISREHTMWVARRDQI